MADISTNFILEAEQLIKEGLFEKAISICEQGMLFYPTYSTAFIILAKAYFLKNDIDTAFQIITKAQTLFPLDSAVVNMKNSIETGNIIIDIDTISEKIVSKEENINNLDLNIVTLEEISEEEEEVTEISLEEISEKAEEVTEMSLEEIPEEEEVTSEYQKEAIEISSNVIEEINEDKEDFSELDKIVNLLKKSDESSITDMSIESDIVDSIEYIETENNILNTELQKVDYITKTNVEKLYEIDLEYARTIISTQFDWYCSNHIPSDFVFNDLYFFNERLYLANWDEALQKAQNTELDTKTQEILNIAESLKEAKIPRIDEYESEEEHFEIPIVASETMAKILVKQEKMPQAIEVYNMLILEKPDKAEYFQNQINLLLSEQLN